MLERVALHTACPTCQGHGLMPARPGVTRTKRCPASPGKGLELTAAGQAIISLLQTAGQGRLMPEG